jgi:glycosyltransferase involved in cell wall biosynthesis
VIINKKLLIITYYWPPAGGPGVQRWLKFVKYLPKLGFMPLVLTVDEQYASYALTDYSLSNEIPSEINIFKTRTRELYSLYLKLTGTKNIPFPGFVNEKKTGCRETIIRFLRTHLFIPDPRKGWNRFALKKATDIIIKEKIDYVVTTSPPHSTQLIGLKLKKRFPGITWLADFRDPWTHIFYFDQLYHTFFSHWLHKRMEGRVISKADRIIVVSPSMKKDFLFDNSKKVEGDKISIIPNGYDQKDFIHEMPVSESTFTITYTGTLASNYRIDALIAATEALNQTGPSKIKLRFVGEISDEYRIKLRNCISEENIELVPPVSHELAIQYLFRSHILLLVIPEAPKNEAIITGKLFEYLAAKKLILGIGPKHGDAAKILSETRAGKMFDYAETSEIKNFLHNSIKHFNSGNTLFQGVNIEKYSRENLTKELILLI